MRSSHSLFPCTFFERLSCKGLYNVQSAQIFPHSLCTWKPFDPQAEEVDANMHPRCFSTHGHIHLCIQTTQDGTPMCTSPPALITLTTRSPHSGMVLAHRLRRWTPASCQASSQACGGPSRMSRRKTWSPSSTSTLATSSGWHTQLPSPWRSRWVACTYLSPATLHLPWPWIMRLGTLTQGADPNSEPKFEVMLSGHEARPLTTFMTCRCNLGCLPDLVSHVSALMRLSHGLSQSWSVIRDSNAIHRLRQCIKCSPACHPPPLSATAVINARTAAPIT